MCFLRHQQLLREEGLYFSPPDSNKRTSFMKSGEGRERGEKGEKARRKVGARKDVAGETGRGQKEKDLDKLFVALV